MKRFTLYCAVLFLQIIGCKDESTNPSGLPEGLQQDIHWASLADSPWPVYHGDPQNSGRSKYAGPLSGKVLYKIPAKSMVSTPILGENNILYFRTESGTSFNAVRNYTEVLWSKERGYEDPTSPIADNENNVYFLTVFDLVKFNSNGDTLWSFKLPSGTHPICASLNIDKSGNIYFLTSDYPTPKRTLWIVNKSGELLWNYTDSRLNSHYHAPAFSPDGNIIYLQGAAVSLIALDINSQSVKWTFGNIALNSAPLVDSEGNIYILPSDRSTNLLSFFSLNSAGGIRWEQKLWSKYGETSEEACMDKYGNIVVGLDDTLYSFSYKGALIWKKGIKNSGITTSIITDNNGNLYFGVHERGLNYENIYKEVAYNKSGQLLWELQLDDMLYPAILNSDGRLIIPNFNSDYIHVVGE